MTRPYNFGAGPAMLPEPLLIEARDELLDWKGSGASIMEIGHRTPEFTALMQHAEETLRRILHIPQNYHVLFMGSAARTQFGMIPINFLGSHQKGAYLLTGIWSEMAYEEARKLKSAYSVASAKPSGYTCIPSESEWSIQENTTYLYYTPNETVNGLRLPTVPKSAGIPLIADMTSCLLSEPINVTDFELIFAGAQKNIANSGLTIVIVRDSWLKKIENSPIPTMFDYRTFAESHSLYATPPTFNCYLADKMFQWVENQGGIEALYKQNCTKAKRLYDYIDSSDFYSCKIVPEYRSLVNVCFTLVDPSLEDIFLKQASETGLIALRGHRLVGGLRASMYNSMPVEGVDYLIRFMRHFAEEHAV